MMWHQVFCSNQWATLKSCSWRTENIFYYMYSWYFMKWNKVESITYRAWVYDSLFLFGANIAQISVWRQSYLFWEANDFPKLKENCELRGTDKNGCYCTFLSFKYFFETHSFEKCRKIVITWISKFVKLEAIILLLATLFYRQKLWNIIFSCLGNLCFLI